MNTSRQGFTLVELLIAIAILAVITAIAIPAYNGYIRESRLGAMRLNLDTLRIAVEAFRLDDPNGSYRSASKAPPYGEVDIGSIYGWRPEGDQNAYDYLVYAATATVYGIQAAQGNTYWVRCDKDSAAGTLACCDDSQDGCTKK